MVIRLDDFAIWLSKQPIRLTDKVFQGAPVGHSCTAVVVITNVTNSVHCIQFISKFNAISHLSIKVIRLIDFVPLDRLPIGKTSLTEFSTLRIY